MSELESRGKKNRSLALANYLIEHMKDKMKFNIRPQRSANLRVLKAAGVPAVLIELGYLSNTEDEKLLTSPEWRAKTAAALAAAVSDFMAERQAAYTVVARFARRPGRRIVKAALRRFRRRPFKRAFRDDGISSTRFNRPGGEAVNLRLPMAPSCD